MKKTILAGLLLAAFSTSMINAKPAKVADPAEAKFFCYVTSYPTVKEGDCTVTYKVITKYFLGCALSSSRSVYSKSCPVTPPDQGGGSGGQN